MLPVAGRITARYVRLHRHVALALGYPRGCSAATLTYRWALRLATAPRIRRRLAGCGHRPPSSPAPHEPPRSEFSALEVACCRSIDLLFARIAIRYLRGQPNAEKSSEASADGSPRWAAAAKSPRRFLREVARLPLQQDAASRIASLPVAELADLAGEVQDVVVRLPTPASRHSWSLGTRGAVELAGPDSCPGL